MEFEKDYKLGLEIKELLNNNNLENPINFNIVSKWDNKIYNANLQLHFQKFLEKLGLDVNDQAIKKTPGRVIKFFINELFYGLNYKNFPKVSLSKNTFKYESPLISKKILFYTTCEHHLVTIRGFALVAYIPNNNIIGLSKINRIVDFFSHRPQIQERLTKQIATSIKYITNSDDVAVILNAKHDCMVIRGVKEDNTSNITFEFFGQFAKDASLKNYLLSLG